MTEVLFYECDVCCTRMPPAEVLGLDEQLKKMIDEENPRDGHICIECFEELKKLVSKWVHDKNE